MRARARSEVRACSWSALGNSAPPVALYLAAAGVGTIGLVDFDSVDLSTCSDRAARLVGHQEPGGRLGTRSAEGHQPRTSHVEGYETRLTSSNALDIARDYDLIVDGTDNFATRYLVNDTSVLLGIPNVYGSVYRFEGQASVFGAPDGPCYRCLFREPPPELFMPSCAEAGVLRSFRASWGTHSGDRSDQDPPRRC